MNVLEWPNQSPHLRHDLKRAIHARKPSSEAESKQFCKKQVVQNSSSDVKHSTPDTKTWLQFLLPTVASPLIRFRGQLFFHRWYLIWNMHAWQIWRKIRYEEEGKYLFLGIVSISDDMTMIPLNFSSFQPSAHHLWSPCICEGSDESYGVRNRKRHLPGTHTHIHIVKWMSVEPQILRWI